MTTAAAIDRLVRHSTILEFNVPSYRTESRAAKLPAPPTPRPWRASKCSKQGRPPGRPPPAASILGHPGASVSPHPPSGAPLAVACGRQALPRTLAPGKNSCRGPPKVVDADQENPRPPPRPPCHLPELVLDTDSPDPQDALPGRRQDFLGRRSRFHMAGASGFALDLQLRKRQAVDLAVRREWETIHKLEPRRHHVGGQLLAQVLAKLRQGKRRCRAAGHVLDQAPIPVRCLLGQNDRSFDARVFSQRCFDLRQLDPEAPDLHWWSKRPRHSRRSSGKPPRQVTRPVQPPPRIPGEGVGHELLRGQLRASPVAPCLRCTSLRELPRGLQVPICSADRAPRGARNRSRSP